MMLPAFDAWALAAAAFVLPWVALLMASVPTLVRLWREPVFRHPVLVIESDDWGAGPLWQVEALDRLSVLLQHHRDGRGRCACLSLAVVLATPDGAAMRSTGRYHPLTLDDPRQGPVLKGLLRAQSLGVCTLQLHGFEHYWPATLASSRDPSVQAWMKADVLATSEVLPSPLQSRWVDASALPSRLLPGDLVRDAVAQEVAAYRRIIGESPTIVVPPTFVWTQTVEDAWAANGIEIIVTPGQRYTRLLADGSVGGAEERFWNGRRRGALTYLARTDYFEPRKGRDAEHAMRALERDTRRGRPCILENHRNNFVGEPGAVLHAEQQLDRLLGVARARFAQLRFASTAEVARAVVEADAAWLVQHWRERLPAVWQRLTGAGRLWKLWRWSGLAALGVRMVDALAVDRDRHAFVGNSSA